MSSKIGGLSANVTTLKNKSVTRAGCPETIPVRKPDVQLGDFGGGYPQDSESGIPVGAPIWSRPYCRNTATDIWSFGTLSKGPMTNVWRPSCALGKMIPLETMTAFRFVTARVVAKEDKEFVCAKDNADG
ncbi:hypothetical protein F4802DRAFT_592050 [Xylaria palmicola]|nr:hypothetical protein F4802DRAFT_592050 [Xylaria palmicola]